MATEDREEKVRFTSWLSAREREALELRCRRERCSLNFIVRSALREYLGMDDDREDNLEQLLHVTSDTATSGPRDHA